MDEARMLRLEMQFADRLLALARDMMANPIPFKEEDHFALMAFLFSSKQIEHLTSIRLLIDAGQARDAALLERAMFEGLCLLLWTLRDPGKRAVLWRSFVFVEDFRLMRKREARGEPIDNEFRSMLQEQLSRYGSAFLTPKAEKALGKRGQVPVDPYRDTWHGQSIRAICEEVGGHLLYEEVYREISGWIHWSPSGLGVTIRRDGDAVAYTRSGREGYRWARGSLIGGFQALIETLVLLDRQFALGFEDRLESLKAEFVRIHEDDAASR